MTEWMSQYQRRVNEERLKRQAPAVRLKAQEIALALKDIQTYLYWSIDSEDAKSLDYNVTNLIDKAHALVDLGHEWRAALKDNPPPPEAEEEDVA